MVNVILTPDADAADGNWKTQTGGSSLFEVIDEASPNDADYIVSGADPTADIVKIRLSNPVGLVNQPMTVSVRARRAGWSAVSLTTRLVEGTITRATWTDDLTSAWATYSHELTEAELATIVDFTDLYVEMEANLVPEICVAARTLNCLMPGYTNWEEHQYGTPTGSQNTFGTTEGFKISVPRVPAHYGADWIAERYGTENTPIMPPGATIDANSLAGLDGSTTASKIVESFDDVPPVIAEKPSSYDLEANHPTAWDTLFWDKAVAVIPAWEGTGNPAYYGEGGALLGTCVPHSAQSRYPDYLTDIDPHWDTITGHGPCLAMGKSDGYDTPDWRIPAVAGEDIVPTDKATILVVQRNQGSGSRMHCMGLDTTNAANRFEFEMPSSHTTNLGATLEAAGNYVTGWDYATANEVKVFAATFGPTDGWCIYMSRPSQYASNPQPLYNTMRVAVPTARTTVAQGGTPSRSKADLDFRLNMGRSVSRESYTYGTPGADILFFALLNEEWTAEQIRVWMADPYAPIRQGNTRPEYPDVRNYHYITAGTPNIGFGIIEYRFTAFVKAAERTRLTLMVGEAATNGQTNGIRCTYDLAGAGAIAVEPYSVNPQAWYEATPWTPTDRAIVPFASGWFKISLDFLIPQKTGNAGGYAQNVVKCRLYADAGSGSDPESILYTGDGSSGLYVWKTNLLPKPAFEQITSLVFEDDFDSTSTIDMNNSLDPGFNWYVKQIAPIFDHGYAPMLPERILVENSSVTQLAASYAEPGVTRANPDQYTTGFGFMTFGFKGGSDGHQTGADAANWVGRAFKLWPSLIQVECALDLLWPSDPTEPQWDGIGAGGYTLSSTVHTVFPGWPAFWTAPLEGITSPCPGGTYPGMQGSTLTYVEFDFLEWTGGGEALKHDWLNCTGYTFDAASWNSHSSFGGFHTTRPPSWVPSVPGSPASKTVPPSIDLSAMNTYSFLLLKETATMPKSTWGFFNGGLDEAAVWPQMAGHDFSITDDLPAVFFMGGYHSVWGLVRMYNDGKLDGVVESNGVDTVTTKADALTWTE